MLYFYRDTPCWNNFLLCVWRQLCSLLHPTTINLNRLGDNLVYHCSSVETIADCLQLTQGGKQPCHSIVVGGAWAELRHQNLRTAWSEKVIINGDLLQLTAFSFNKSLTLCLQWCSANLQWVSQYWKYFCFKPWRRASGYHTSNMQTLFYTKTYTGERLSPWRAVRIIQD